MSTGVPSRSAPGEGPVRALRTDEPGQAGADSRVIVRYWAGARHAAGVDEEERRAATVGDLVATLTQERPAMAGVLGVCAVLVEGRSRGADDSLRDGDVVEFLPPFAGG